MANTTFNTRIKLKYDTLANWTTNEAKVLLAGEVGLCYVPSVTSGTTTTAPTILFKVGDGKTTWGELPWGSGLGLKLPQNHLMIIVRLKILPL